MQQQVLELLSARRGHFLLESGHHGDLWLDLETLCRDPSRVQPVVDALAAPLATLALDAVCGPLVEGAFVALMVAQRLGVAFTYAERFARPSDGGLFPVGYRVPGPLRGGLRGKRVAIVNDVINAGSAVRGTFEDLRACGAQIVNVSALLVLGSSFETYAEANAVPLKALARLPNTLWAPADCPLCAAKMPLQDVAGFAAAPTA